MEIPETSLIRKTLILRKLDLPPNVMLTKRSLLRWLALSLGLISERESRTTVLHILDGIFYFLLSKKQNPTSADIKQYLEKEKHLLISERLVRYHLRKLTELGILTRKNARYAINPAPDAERENIASAVYYIKEDVSQCCKTIEKALEKLSEFYTPSENG